MKHHLSVLLCVLVLSLSSQKRVYDINLLGKKIGYTIAERIDKGNGEVEYKLNSSSHANIFFVNKTSELTYDVIYRNGKLFSSYCKVVKDDVVEIVDILWDGAKYIIKKGEERMELAQPVDFSALSMYFQEPKGRIGFFSERLARMVGFSKSANGIYECKLDNGVLNTYHYRNGELYELEMSKGVSILMKLAK